MYWISVSYTYNNALQSKIEIKSTQTLLKVEHTLCSSLAVLAGSIGNYDELKYLSIYIYINAH